MKFTDTEVTLNVETTKIPAETDSAEKGYTTISKIGEKLNESGLAKGIENWVFEGDSWTAGTAQSNSQECWPYYLLLSSYARTNVNGFNVATAGQTAATMVSTFAAQVAPHLTATSGRPSMAFIFAGINDSSGTKTQLRDNLRSLWTSARNAGAKVVAFTLPARTAG